jgi:UDP-3-O-[3-hydroxymyristoyl] glucosamine N-acyltransferase
MKKSLSEIATLVGGTLSGDGDIIIEGAARLSEAGEKDISFLGNNKYLSQLKSTKAGAVLVAPGVDTGGRPSIHLKNPPFGWAKVLELINGENCPTPSPGIHSTAVVSSHAEIGKDVFIGPFVVIEDGVRIGDGSVIQAHSFIGRNSRVGVRCFLHPRVTIQESVSVGDRCVFQPGAVVGCDGFGFVFQDGRHHKIPQIGTVVVGDDVEIQANATIDRAAIGATVIGTGTKIDNLVQVAHNVDIGEHCLLVSLTGVAGSTKLGKYVTLAAQVGVAGHLEIGDRVQVGGRGGVTTDLKAGEVVWGTPAHPLKDELRVLASIRRLPALLSDFKNIKKKLGI